MIIDKRGYIARKTTGGRGRSNNKHRDKDYRNWFIIKNGASGGVISLRDVYVPPHLIGEHIRLKVEFIKYDGDTDGKQKNIK